MFVQGMARKSQNGAHFIMEQVAQSVRIIDVKAKSHNS